MKTRYMRFLKALSEERDPEALQKKFLDLFLEMPGVAGGSIWIRRETGCRCIEAAGTDAVLLRDMTLSSDQAGIVGRVMESGKTMVALPREDSPRLHPDALPDKTLLLCFPLLLSEGRVYGAVRLADIAAGGNPQDLDPEYLDMLRELVDIGAISLKSALDFASQLRKNRLLRGVLDNIRQEDSLVGASPHFMEVMKLVAGYAATDYPVIIIGESGTGKDLLARELHRRSSRAKRPFLAQNCSAIPGSLLESELFGYARGAFTGAVKGRVGLFEASDRGTLFLDEIGEMEVGLQAKLLRVLENNEIKPLGGASAKTVDVRVISATNRDIDDAVATGRFRRDLFYRLNVLPLKVPPLRDRRDDVPLLARHFLKRETLQAGRGPEEFTPETLELLMEYAWPGNVRELENLVKKLMVTVPGQLVRPGDLPDSVRTGRSTPVLPLLPSPAPEPGDPSAAQSSGPDELEDRMAEMSWREMEQTYVLTLLKRCRWNVTRAALAAGVNRSTFDSRMRRLGVSKRG